MIYDYPKTIKNYINVAFLLKTKKNSYKKCLISLSENVQIKENPANEHNEFAEL